MIAKWCKFLVLSSLVKSSRGEVKNTAGSLAWNQKYRAFWSENEDSLYMSRCEAIVIIGVGTGMGIDDYNHIASKIVERKPYVVVIADHNSGSMMKLFGNTFSQFYNAFMDQLHHHISVCQMKYPIVIFGGHSASGHAAIRAFPHLKQKPDGFIGLDPYKVTTDLDMNNTKALIWGFKETTCAVDVHVAAKIAYEISSPLHRVFYRVKNDLIPIYHCAFADNGCSSFCRAQHNDTWVKDAVAMSIHLFIMGIQSQDFQKYHFEIQDYGANFDLFVNADDTADRYELKFSSERY